MRRDLLPLAIFLLLVPSAADAERLPIRAYTTADGLGHNTVNRIIRDSRGFLWFATDDGLSRFDGYTFTNYSVEQGLPHRRVMDLLETRNGDLWIATFGGLVRFRPDRLQTDRIVDANDTGGAPPMFATIVPADEDPRARALTVLLESRDGTIWCGTRKGLFRLQRTASGLQLHPVAIGLLEETPEQKFLNGLAEDEHGSLWISARSGLYRRWSDGTTARYSAAGLFADRFPNLHPNFDFLQSLMKDRRGRIWVTSRGLGFFRIGADGSRRAPAVLEQHAYPNSWIDGLLETSDGRFWAASTVGLLELRPGEGSDRSRLVPYDRSQGLSHQELSALAEDASGNLWIGTWAAGAMKLARSGFLTYGRADGVASANTLFEDSTGQMYIYGGFFEAGAEPAARRAERTGSSFGRFDGRRFEWFRPAPPYVQGWVGEGFVTRSRGGDWWIGGANGLFRYSRLASFYAIRTATPARVFDTNNGLPIGQIFRLFEDSRGNLWISIISAINGLVRWNRATDALQDMAVVEGLPRMTDELPRAFGEDGAGNVWIGLNNGVARYRKGSFAFFKTARGLPLGTVVHIHSDRARRVWLASSSAGLIRVDDPSADAPAFTRFSIADGLSGNSVEMITEDLQGRLYVATGRGVDQFDPSRGAVRQFTTADGLAAGMMVAAFRDHTGALWFGTQTGLSRFVPESPARPAPPAILITAMTVAGRPWPVSAIGETSIALPDLRPDGQHLQIDFASLRFSSGERLRYQYRLEGSDAAWSPLTSRRSVSFASFSPGTYRFLVRAVNADGVASPQPAAVAFTVLAPLWMRGWFLTLTALAVVSAAFALHRYRLARILELERLRTRIATDLHDDVGANLTRIAILSEVMRQQPGGRRPELDSPLSSIADIARESVATMSDIVWAINPERDTLGDMVRRMREHAEEIFESRDIRVLLDMPAAAHPVRLGVDIRREVYLVFKEAVNNAARHSNCSTVAIVLRATRSEVWLEVSDDGVGFNPGNGREGNGLANMRRRAERLGAALDVFSGPGLGTTVRLRIPTRESALSG